MFRPLFGRYPESMKGAHQAKWTFSEKVLTYLLIGTTLIFVPGAGSPFILPKLFILLVGATALFTCTLLNKKTVNKFRLNLVTTLLLVLWVFLLIAAMRNYSIYSAIFGEYNRFNGLATYSALILVTFSIISLCPIESFIKIAKVGIYLALLITVYGLLQL